MDMDYLTLEHKKFLVEHYVYDAWQFTNNAAKGVATARFCCEAIKKLIIQSNEEYTQWQNDMFTKLFEDSKINGTAQIGIGYDNIYNGHIVNESTHDIITRNSINDENELYELCEKLGWNTDWYSTYINYFNN